MRKIIKGDNVVITTGKDKGRQGKVLKIMSKSKKPKSGLWVVVEGLNIVKKHVKANPQAEQPGGIKSKEAPVHVSNVALVDPTTNKASRVRIKELEDGRKVRSYCASGEVVDV